MKKSTTADSFTTHLRSVSSGSPRHFLEVSLLKGAGQTPMLIGKTLLSFLRKDAPGWISYCKLSCRSRDAKLLFAFHNGADSYTTLQLILFAF